MSAWVDRGFVPDSDEEESQESNEGQKIQLEEGQEVDPNVDEFDIAAGQNPLIPRPVYASQAATLLSSPQPAKDISRSHGQNVSVIIPSNEREQASHTVARAAEVWQDESDALSSALSDPLSEIEIESVVAAERQTGPAGQQPVPAASADAVDDEPYDIDLHEQALAEARSGRTFRLRKAIQLHPYLLEGERYRAILKGRGVKPIRVETQPHERHRASQYEATQAASFEGAVPVALSSPPPNQLRVASLSPTQEVASSPNRFILPRGLDLGRQDQEDCGDPDGTLLRKVNGGVQYGRKRRKTAATQAIPGRSSSSKIIVEDMTMFDVPPSPPSSRSSALTPVVESNVNTVPVTGRFTSPKLLPTPIASSGSRRPLRRIVDSDDESLLSPRSNQRQLARAPSDASMATPIPIESASERGSDSSSAETVRSVELRRIRRRIKGVLPASWLTIDQQARKPGVASDKSRHLGRPVDPSVPVKGVAQRISRPSTARSHQSANPDVQRSILKVSDDSSSAEDQPQTPSIIEPAQSPVHPLFRRPPPLNDATQDIPEDNRIDTMLPPASRKHYGRRQRKRQSSLIDTFRHQSRGSEMGNRSSSGLRKSMQDSSLHNDLTEPRNHSKTKHGTKRKTAPRLSIVDVVTASAPGRPDSVPRFLRVAARRARQQPGQGKHSPTGKHIRLQTSDDTEDALSSLRAWREGTIKSDSSHPRKAPESQRLPLQPRDDNQQQRLPSPTKIASSTARQVRQGQTGNASLSRVRQSKLKAVAISRQDGLRQKYSFEHVMSRSVSKRPQFFRDPVYRTAQLESSEWHHYPIHQSAVLQRLMARASPDQQRPAGSALSSEHHGSRLANDKFTHLPSASSDALVARPSLETAQPAPGRKERQTVPRKRLARRVDVETRAYRQPSEVILIQDQDEQPQEVDVGDKPVVEGLGPFGTKYTTDFDIAPLHRDTYFHESTFIGSGLLAKALKTANRNMSPSAPYYSFRVGGRYYRMGPWNEDVFSQIEVLLLRPSTTMSATLSFPSSGFTIPMERLIEYLSTSITFVDPGDEVNFVKKTSTMMSSLADSFTESLEKLESSTTSHAAEISDYLASSTRCIVLASQVLQIGRNGDKDNTELMSSLTSLTKSVVGIVLRTGLPHVRSFLDENKRHAIRERGIRSEDIFVETLVVVYTILDALALPQCSFWGITSETLSVPIVDACRVLTFERTWYDVFTLLPILCVDSHGLLKAALRTPPQHDGSALVKQLLSRTFALVSTTASTKSSSSNDYIRACLCRCHCLITTWGWRHCELMLGAIFDFFAHNGLAQLRLEESHGSSSFLERLGGAPSLAVRPDDRSFNIFLKALASGLRGMCEVYPKKKIQSIAWRFIPNHGRTYRKDQAIKQSDLDALRNHHDLLCVLYWASPVGYRPRLTTIRNLVDHSASHREACRLNVRAWGNLARYQASTGESASNFEPFVAWIQDIVLQTVKQYQRAKPEAEKQYEEAQRNGNVAVTLDILQRTIKINQAQVLVTLRDAVAGVREAVAAAKSRELASSLIQQAGLDAVFALFDARVNCQESLFVEALEAVRAYINGVSQALMGCGSEKASEESQDYGDFPDLDLEEGGKAALATTLEATAIEFLHECLWHLLSNSFGSDFSPDDRLLTAVVDAWIAVVRHSVHSRIRDWSAYIDPHGSFSWQQLPKTEQTHKYTPYWLSKLIGAGPPSLSEYKQTLLTAWLMSLLERESTIKFQHAMTAALLTHYPDHTLLQNMPFLQGTSGAEVVITASDLRDRRLSVISTVLSNMRSSFETTIHEDPVELLNLKRTYTDLLRQVMATMKKIYQSLPQDTKHARGAYVTFVQSIVEMLQQYTSDICPIDKFFTDSSAFPLPATDPTYVVGRLRGYALKLTDHKTLKQLAVFIQTVTERAAIDNQQAYLVGQLGMAMSSTFECGEPDRPSLRSVLLQAIFPAYFEVAFKSAAGWVLAEPMLQASALVLSDLIYDFDATSAGSCGQVTNTIVVLLDTFQKAAELLIDHSGLLEQAHTLHTLALVFQVIAAVLPSADYITRRIQCTRLRQQLAYFDNFATFVSAYVNGVHDAAAPMIDDCGTPTVCAPTERRLAVIRTFCTNELSQAMSRWGVQGEQYWFVRGNVRREVVVDLGTYEEEREELLGAFEDSEAMMERMKALRMEVVVRNKNHSRGLGLDDLVI